METPAPAEPAATATDTPEGAPSETTTGTKRRRGSRGGRGRKKPGATAAAGEAAEKAGDAPATPSKRPDAGAKRTEKKDGDRQSRRGGQRSGGKDRRRPPQRRAPLPSAKRELLITVDVGEQRVALLEDDKVAEVYLERPERRSIAGNIYLGTVDNVLPGMEAAFVEIGLEKNGFLYVDEIIVPELEGTRHGKKITDLIQRGQEILVQAVKDPMKTKGARLTTEISLPGRFLVYVPNGEGLGVSRRLEDAERQRLKDILKEIAPATGGVIVRTAAEGASAEDVERDLVFLQRLWKTIQARAKAAKAPELVYQEAELPLRIVRDLFAGDFAAAHVDSDRTYKRIVGYLKKTSPHMVERVHRTKEKEPLFERYGVEKEIASTIDRRVDLPSGGYLIFDYAEAFTVIDVNTGRFVGSRSKSSTQRLEDTAVKNNLEAVKEVVRQLRLRDIGGIIVIDFIDMANPKNRQAVEETLRTELDRDRTKTFVVEISPLGLVEMTRQNVTDGPREVMTRRCPTCAGDGIVVSDATVALEVERRLRALAAAGAGSRIQAYKVAVHPRALTLLAGAGGARLAALEEATRRRFYLVPATGHAHVDHLEVLAEGRRDDLAPTVALEEGTELELKLVEIDLHDGTAAVGKHEGLDVVVADAAKLVGKKAKVQIGRVLEGRAFATLVSGAAPAAPITFESEAEKPTRAPARRKPGEVEAAVDAPAAEEAAEPAEADAAEDVEDEPEADAETEDGEPAPARKRTRRGSRGGRRRKKPAGAEADATEDGDAGATDAAEPETGEAAADDAEEATDEAPTARAPARRRTPRIHVPDDARATGAEATDDAPPASLAEIAPEEPTADELASPDDDGEPAAPKKRTRRGTRGGRNRKRKTVAANGDAADSADADADAHADAEVGADAEVDHELETPETEPEVPDAETPAEAPEPVAAEVAVVAEDGDGEGDGYVPMSEWIGDFDRRG
ncbi:MAG TPA: Rne/Rng family ribonuclease [Gaiella sp.]|nr:Rne/Rng family ribonuclease [Gaiella sp.]